MLDEQNIKIFHSHLTNVPTIVTLAFTEMNKYLEYAYDSAFDWQSWENDIRGIILANDKLQGIVECFNMGNSDEIIGFWWITPSLDHLWIDAFVIKSEYQHQGIGTYLVKNFLNHFSYFDPINKKIELGVQNNNVRAINFYKKLGFNIIEDSYMDTFKSYRMVKSFIR